MMASMGGTQAASSRADSMAGGAPGGLTTSTWTSGRATARSCWRMTSVISTLALGLMTRMRMAYLGCWACWLLWMVQAWIFGTQTGRNMVQRWRILVQKPIVRLG